jgi:hypothetical protein
MAEMPCDVAKEKLSAYMDDELDTAQRSDVEGHIETCTQCTEELALLRAGENAVEELVEYGTPRSFETELRRAIKNYRPPSSMWWSLGGRVTTRHLAIGLSVVCGALLLLGAFYLRDTTSGPIQSVTRAEPVSQTVAPKVEKPLSQETSRAVASPPPERTKPPEQKEPEPVVQASAYVGWWMVRIDGAQDVEFPLQISQDKDSLVIKAWGGREPLAEGAVGTDRLSSVSEDIQVDLAFDSEGLGFTGSINRPEIGEYDVSGEYVMSYAAIEFFETAGGLRTAVDSRLALGQKISKAIYEYARAHRDRFPSALDDLVPEFISEDEISGRATVLGQGSPIETTYSRPSVIPTDEVVDWDAYGEEEISVDDRFEILSQRSLPRFDAYFEEMAALEWSEFPAGRVIIYLDGSVAYDGVKTVPEVLLPEEYKRALEENERACLGNVNVLGRAIIAFANDHEGLFPTSIDMLWPEYLKDAGALCCPERPPHEIVHEIPVLGDELPTEEDVEGDPDLLSTIIIVEEPDEPHRGGFHLLSADGKAVWKSGDER